MYMFKIAHFDQFPLQSVSTKCKLCLENVLLAIGPQSKLNKGVGCPSSRRNVLGENFLAEEGPSIDWAVCSLIPSIEGQP